MPRKGVSVSELERRGPIAVGPIRAWTSQEAAWASASVLLPLVPNGGKPGFPKNKVRKRTARSWDRGLLC